MNMYLSGLGLEDFISGLGELKVGDTARGAFSAALPKPPIRHMWERVPGTEERPSSGGLSTFLYKLVRYEDDPAPLDVSKFTKSEAELVAEANKADVKLQQMVADIDAKEKAMAAEKAAAATQAQRAATLSLAARQLTIIDVPKDVQPWYKRTGVLAGIIGAVAAVGITGVWFVRK